MIQVRKKEKETAESLIRRFSRRVQQSGVLRQVRKQRFRVEEQSRDKRRSEALYKVKIRKEIKGWRARRAERAAARYRAPGCLLLQN